MTFVTKQLNAKHDVLAPDGSEVRLLAATGRGSMAHFKLHPGQTSKAMHHRTVEEVWFITAGRGEMWRSSVDREEITALSYGVSISIPVGTSFQFRCIGDQPFEAVAVTMPPWPGVDEAVAVAGKW
jgi:mannose-6-phosphate isomerase-like protein (cupin superfamily)